MIQKITPEVSRDFMNYLEAEKTEKTKKQKRKHIEISRKAAVPTGSRELAPVRTGTGGTGTGGTGTRNRTGNLEILEIWKSGNSRNPRNLEIDRILEIPEF